MPDRITEIRRRLDSIQVGRTIVGVRWMRRLIADSVWLLYAARDCCGDSERLDEIAVRLAWWLQPSHHPVVMQPVNMAQVVETVSDARWLLAQIDECHIPGTRPDQRNIRLQDIRSDD